MTEMERLKEELKWLTAENTRLKGLLEAHGISWRPVQMSLKRMDASAEIARRIGLFMKLFCARRDFYAERWESRDGRKGYAPVCRNR